MPEWQPVQIAQWSRIVLYLFLYDRLHTVLNLYGQVVQAPIAGE